MTEKKQELREALGHLHDELKSTESVDPDLRGDLQTILNDIHNLLDRSESQAAEDQPLADRLTEAVGSFETAHPKLAEAISRISQALSDMGI
jgi:division protein CdvB (Snf7/Vps24/ESCRT-III family)